MSSPSLIDVLRLWLQRHHLLYDQKYDIDELGLFWYRGWPLFEIHEDYITCVATALREQIGFTCKLYIYEPDFFDELAKVIAAMDKFVDHVESSFGKSSRSESLAS